MVRYRDRITYVSDRSYHVHPSCPLSHHIRFHRLPIGAFAFAISFTGGLSRIVSPKWILLSAQGALVIATILLHFADGPDKYFQFVLPAFILGTSGCMFTYTHTKYVPPPTCSWMHADSPVSIAIFQTSPPSMAGTVGAIFNGALQLGSAVGLAAVSSIETSVEAKHGGPTSYAGRAAAFWFLLGVVCLEAISLTIFYRVEAVHQVQPEVVEEVRSGPGKLEKMESPAETPIEEKQEFKLSPV